MVDLQHKTCIFLDQICIFLSSSEVGTFFAKMLTVGYVGSVGSVFKTTPVSRTDLESEMLNYDWF